MVKNLLTIIETWVLFLGQEDPLEKGMATHSSILAGRTPWTEEPGGLQSMGLHRVRHDWATNTFTFKTGISVFQLRVHSCVYDPMSTLFIYWKGAERETREFDSLTETEWKFWIFWKLKLRNGEIEQGFEENKWPRWMGIWALKLLSGKPGQQREISPL